MAKTSTLGSPGIEVNEVDNSVRPSTSTACTILVPGFASQGPVEEITSIGTLSDFQTIYGTPTNAAERYFYHSVKALKENSGPGTHVLATRLPYGSGEGDNISSSYTLLAYPAIPVAKLGDSGHDQYLIDEGRLKRLLTIKTDMLKVSDVRIIKNVKSEGIIESGEDGTVFESVDSTLAHTSSHKVYELIEEVITDSDVKQVIEAESLEPGFHDLAPYGIEKCVFVFEETQTEVNEDGETEEVTKLVAKYVVGNSNITGHSELKAAYEVLGNLDTPVKVVQQYGADATELQDEQKYKIVWNLDSASQDQIISAFEITTPEVSEDLMADSIEVEGLGELVVVSAEGNSFAQMPTEVSYDIIVQNNSLAEDETVVIKSFGKETEVDGEGEVEDMLTLPQYGVSGSAQIVWDVVADSAGMTTTGKVATERDGADTIVSISAPLVRRFNASSERDEIAPQQVGLIRVTARYTGVTIRQTGGTVGYDWQFVPVTSTDEVAVAEYKAAYEILTNSFRYKDESGQVDISKSVAYVIGAPITYHISVSEYNSIVTGEAFSWGDNPLDLVRTETYKSFDQIKNAAFIVINKSRTTVNEGHEGYFIGMSDNMFVSPSDDYVYNAIDSVKTTTKVYNSRSKDSVGIVDEDFDKIKNNRLNFYLDSNYQGSISRIMETGVTKFDMSPSDYDDTLNIGLFKMNKASTAQDALKLSYSIHETYNASFGAKRQKTTNTSSKAVSYFVENELENSSNITILVNPFLSSTIHLDGNGDLKGKMRMYGPKLMNNLDLFEKKYLVNTFNLDRTTKTAYDTAIAPIRLARQCVDSYANLMDQAGLTLDIIDQIKTDYPLFCQNSSLYQFGTYQETSKAAKNVIGNVPAKVRRALELVSNDEEYPNIDIIIEAGLGTIYAYSNGATVIGESSSLMTEPENDDEDLVDEDAIKQTNFVDTIILQGIEDLRTGQPTLSDEAQSVVEDYTAVQNSFLGLATAQVKGGRGDTFYIPDVLRGILIKGRTTKVQKMYGTELINSIYSRGDNVNHSWSTSIYYPIKHSTENITSNYLSMYCQWFKVLDDFSGEKVWIPASPYIAALMGATDASDGPWTAAAGINRGVINGVIDYAISPTLSQRTDLYNICVNSIPQIPNTGLCVWGIRTMGRKDSAFDQNTCRRTFLYLEKVIKRYLRNYIFEKNTTYTRLQIVNDVEPLLNTVLNNGGIYNYTVTCDATNNTPDIINNGDLAVDVSASPTRTAENIVLTMVANKYTNVVNTTSSLS